MDVVIDTSPLFTNYSYHGPCQIISKKTPDKSKIHRFGRRYALSRRNKYKLKDYIKCSVLCIDDKM